MATLKLTADHNKMIKVSLSPCNINKKRGAIGYYSPTAGFGKSLDDLTPDVTDFIASQYANVIKSSDTVKVDTDDLSAVNQAFVVAAPTGYRTAAMRHEDWVNAQPEVTERQSFDNMNNEGAEGFNPYA